MLAPSGRVMMYASQDDRTGCAPSCQAMTTAPISGAGSSTDDPGPQPVSSSVHSPTAVPSAKVTSTVSQEKASRGVVTMLWMDKVRPRAYPRLKTAARASAKTGLLSPRGTPAPSVRSSVSSVPTTLIRTTASQ